MITVLLSEYVFLIFYCPMLHSWLSYHGHHYFIGKPWSCSFELKLINYCSSLTDKAHDQLLDFSDRTYMLTFIFSNVSGTAPSVQLGVIRLSVSQNLIRDCSLFWLIVNRSRHAYRIENGLYKLQWLFVGHSDKKEVYIAIAFL